MADDLTGASSDPIGTATSGRASRFPTAQLKVRTLNSSNFTLWNLQLLHVCKELKCLNILSAPSPDHEDDYRAIHFMVESSPPELQYRIARCKTAYEAYQFIKDKYVGGKDAAYVRELEDKFAKLKMLSSETVEMYIHRAEEIGLRLNDNNRSPLPDVFVDRIIDGLPSAFDDSKSALKVVTVGKKMDEIQQIIAKTAINVGWQPSKSGDKKEEKVPAALNVGKPTPGGGKGNQGKGRSGQGRRVFNIICDRCGEAGHIAKFCPAVCS